MKGSAAAAISGISVTTENYDLAIAMLKERFGKKEPIIGSLYAKLQNIPRASNKFSEIKYNHEVIEKTLRQLEAQGESVADQRMLIQQLLCKYPTDVIVKLSPRNLILLGVCQHYKRQSLSMLQWSKMLIVLLIVKEINLLKPPQDL